MITLVFEDTQQYQDMQHSQRVYEHALIISCDLACLSEDAIQEALYESRREFAATVERARRKWEQGEAGA